MKFNGYLDKITAVVPAHSQTIFRTRITTFATGVQPRRISSISHKSVNVFTGQNMVKRFYNFILMKPSSA